jgi:hypothetical protein
MHTAHTQKEKHRCPICRSGIDHIDWMLSFPMGYCVSCGPKVTANQSTITALKREVKGGKRLQCRMCHRTIGVYQHALQEGKCRECEPGGNNAAS